MKRHQWMVGSVLLAAALFAACSKNITVSTLDYNPQRGKATTWGQQYMRARAMVASQPAQACASFAQLAGDPSSSIGALALARQHQNCNGGDLNSALISLDRLYDDPLIPWLRPLLTELITDLAVRAGNNQLIVKHAFARSKQLGSQPEKEDLLTKAAAAARALGLNDKVLEFETELYRGSPRLETNPNEDEWLRAADDFRVNEQWDPALALYNRMITSKHFGVMDQFRARNGIREVYKAKFRFYQFPLSDFLAASLVVQQFTEAQLDHPGPLTFDERRVLYEGWLQYARDEWSYGDVNIAKREITRGLKLSWMIPAFKAHAYWTESRIHANNGDWAAAAASAAESTKILNAELGGSGQWTKWHWTLWDDAHWAGALANRKIRHYADAGAILDAALRHTKNDNTELKFTFWLAQCLKDQGITSGAETYNEKLTGKDPHGFYGFLAYRELGRDIPNLPDLNLSLVQKPSSMSADDFELIMALRLADETELAQKYSQRVMNPNSVEPEDLFLRAYLNDYATIQNIFFSRIPAAERNDFTAKYARLFYPEPFRDLVDSAVVRNPRIDKEYVYSIMRQESGFNPWVRSWANAYGLLQIIPKVARETQAKAGVTFTDDYQLFRPEMNIPIGVAHMDDLIDRAGAPFILRTSAYNATVEKTLEWKQRLFQGNVYEYLEEIPYDETRSYIRLVMRNYIMNLRLNSQRPFAFPESLLSL